MSTRLPQKLIRSRPRPFNQNMVISWLMVNPKLLFLFVRTKISKFDDNQTILVYVSCSTYFIWSCVPIVHTAITPTTSTNLSDFYCFLGTETFQCPSCSRCLCICRSTYPSIHTTGSLKFQLLFPFLKDLLSKKWINSVFKIERKRAITLNRI